MAVSALARIVQYRVGSVLARSGDVRLSREDWRCRGPISLPRRITMQVKRAELVESVQIVADADWLTSRAGTALLVGLADRVGLTGVLSSAMAGVRRRCSR